MAIVVSTGAPNEPLHSPHVQKKRRQARFLIESGIILVVLAFVGILRLLAFEGALVTSGSMEPTLRKGDYMLVDHRVALRHNWERGDVVIFDTPPSWSGGADTLVKRVIGLPGERIGILGGRVLINAKPLPENYFGEKPELDDMEYTTLGPDQYFVMGDNRNHSDDSRANGPIEESNIRGRTVCKLWPLGRFGMLTKPDYSGNQMPNPLQ